MLLFLGSSQISGGELLAVVAGLGRRCEKSGSSRRLPRAPRQDCLREGPLQALSMSSEPLPQKAQESVTRQETEKEDPGSSSPQSHDRRPVRVSRGHQFPHATPPVCAGKFSEVQRQEPALVLPSFSFLSPSGQGARLWKRSRERRSQQSWRRVLLSG